jgi:outer membrane protein assembly factor BamA
VPQSQLVSEIVSEEMEAEDVAALAQTLGIKVGSPLANSELDRLLREAGDSGKWTRVFVNSASEGGKLKVFLKGVRVRRLRNLEYSGVEDSILEEVRRKFRTDEERSTDSQTFLPLRQWLREAHEERGYYFASVQLRVRSVNSEEADVEVLVSAGKPTRVARLTVVGGPESEIEALREQIPLQKGDIFSKSRLSEGTDRVNAYLRSNQYPTSRVVDTDVRFLSESNTVEITVKLKMGERFQFRFTGNSVFDDVALKALVTDEVLSQADPSTRVVQLIEKKYRSVGYPDCSIQVTKATQEQGKLSSIEMAISEGERVLIQSVRFSSQREVNGIDLEDLFYESAPPVLERRLYWAEGVTEATAAMQARLFSQGYLNARIGDPKATFSQDRRRVDLFIDADLGTQTRVGKIVFVGNNRFASEKLLEVTGLRSGDPYNKESVVQASRDLFTHYSNAGFPLMKFVDPAETTVQVSVDGQWATIRFVIDEGELFKIGTVQIEGLRKTRAQIVLQELGFDTGSVYDGKKVKQAEETISLLGLFSRVEIVETPSTTPGVMNIRIMVQETRPGVGEIGFGGVYEEPRLRLRPFVGIAYRNVSGMNQTASVRGDLGLPISRSGSELQIPFVEYSTVLGYRYPYAFHLPMTLATQLAFDRVEVRPAEQTILTRARIEARLEKTFSSKLTAVYRLIRVERTTTESFRPAAGSDSTPFTESIGSTGPGIILDLRDDIFNPRRGSFHSLDLELASPLLFSQSNISFFLALFRNSFYVPVGKSLGLVVFTGLGFAQSLQAGAPIARARLVNELSLGGQGSIRGIAPRALTASDPSTTGSIAFYNARAEANLTLFADFGVAVFFDTGQIFPGFVPTTRSDGVGLGLRYKTPVGPVVIDFAQGLGPLAQNVKFYFTVGTL